MLWLIITAVVIAVGLYFYFNSKKTDPQTVSDIHNHSNHNESHSHKSGHGCCK